MARKNESDNQAETNATRSADDVQQASSVQADQNSVAVGGISIGGDVTGTITIGHGYTAEQVSLLLIQIASNYQRKPFDGRCPYKGLEVFEEEDAELFFGRERLLEDLLGRVKESRTVFITGPSGSGKSSLVRAGLIHALKRGALKGSDRWLYETMKPGREPIKELSLAFSRLKGPDLSDYFLAHANEGDVLNKCAESVLINRQDQRFVLFVDQFEEVFTQINQEEERQAFINMLSQAGTVENGRVIVLFAMRSDFVSNCATYPALNELLSQEFRQIGAMQPDELVAAIALPAKEVGLPIEEELIARIINDMKGEPGALPLMQFALKDLFDAQQAKSGVIALTLADYLKHGGIQKSLERHADASLGALDEKGQALARSIFSGLIEIGRGTADTKRTALFDELVPANASTQEVVEIVQKLADARLIITDEQAGKDTVTISHEKLIEAWPWLKKLVNENRDVIALQNKIANDAKEWEEHKFDASYLYTGARLITVYENLTAKKLFLNDTSEKFIKAGQVQQRRSRQRTITSAVLVITMLMLLVIIAVLVVPRIQEQIARRQARADSVLLPAGEFYMGSTDPNAINAGERNAWLASTSAFFIDKYEVSNLQYSLCMKYGGCTPPGNPSYRDPNYRMYPVTAVNVYQANAYCRWLGGRLPTELEWVRAARGLNDQRFWPWGDAAPTNELTNMPLDSSQPTGLQHVTSSSEGRSPEGMQNLIGNASEWTSSYYQEDYHNGSLPYDYHSYWNGQVNTYDGTRTFLQLGGGWQASITYLTQISPSESIGYSANSDTGFRCVFDL